MKKTICYGILLREKRDAFYVPTHFIFPHFLQMYRNL